MWDTAMRDSATSRRRSFTSRSNGSEGDEKPSPSHAVLFGPTSSLAEVNVKSGMNGKSTTSGTSPLCGGLRGPWAVDLKRLVQISLPLSTSQLCQFSIVAVLLIFVGSLGVEEIGAASIAIGLINATGFAFGSGLCGALETVLSQSYGCDPRNKMFGVYAQRMFLILLLFCIPLGGLLFYVDTVLIGMGQKREVALLVGAFCRISIVGLPFVMALELLRRYYAAQHVTAPLTIVLVGAAVANPVLQYLTVGMWGYHGVAWGWVILTIAMVAALVGYMRLSGLYRSTWGGVSREALQQWGPLFRLALPSLGMALSEWTTIEISSVSAGYGSERELAAYAIGSQIVSICWSITSGVFIASSVLVGNAIGEGKPLVARRYAYMSMGLVFAVSLVNSIIVVVMGSWLARLFNTDLSVGEAYIDMIPSLIAYHILDAQQSNILGILRGCGLQNMGVVIVTVCYAVVGIPLGLVLFLQLRYSINALWYGPVIGIVVVALPAYYYLFTRYIKWELLVPHLEKATITTMEDGNSENMVAVAESSFRNAA